MLVSSSLAERKEKEMGDHQSAPAKAKKEDKLIAAELSKASSWIKRTKKILTLDGSSEALSRANLEGDLGDAGAESA